MSDLKLKPIAVVRNGIRETPDDWDKVQSRLILDKRYSEGLFKLGHFKHIWVIFGFHKMRMTELRVHPRHDPEIPFVGVFASRSPTRPNKLGLTLVKLVSVKGGVVTVKGLDAFDGSPVFDIKPYEEEIDY
ncbi:MAG: tRNA (N6-threonylcarbamoyladenosine(37)-N6)-methyltransferase TrmO [Candidatus Thermoplasmatota archaeon]|nr:tRNA (N6-threonylcarbamoyladenosine(37)-N6)-methyltransferase TrmO [Candidatus Thermoplasmatota archaeon]MBU1914189.1 tRNA (N6-threonylcarbamoyladenosine(37)-N6)-methyltransferase TrmO [Candidatus Thermoplasmatota archaeon]